MNTNRRIFIKSLSVGLVGSLFDSAKLSAAKVDSIPAYSSASPEHYWEAIRSQYPLLHEPVYLNTGGLGPVPQCVHNAVVSTITHLQEHCETGHTLFEPARSDMAQFLGVKSNEISFVRNASEANSIIASGLRLKAGDEVIFDSHAHPGGSYPWLILAKQSGVVVKLFEPDATSPEANLKLIRSLITNKTKVIQVSHITCTTGLIMPVKRIAALSKETGIWFHIDGAQALGMIPLNISDIGCDSYAASGHKWMGGPHETGILYIKQSNLDKIAMVEGGSYSGKIKMLPGDLTLEPRTMRHEYGTRNAGLVVGLQRSVSFQNEIGRDKIANRGKALASILMDSFSKMNEIKIMTPQESEMRASITTIQHPRATAEDFFEYLFKKKKLRCRLVSEQGLRSLRISTHIMNSPDECERVIAGVHASLKDL
jgi:selenocysteine lyase/cysteine desulfurase